MSIDTIIFDLDGVLFETEEVWNDVRHEFAVAHGGHWGPEDQPMVMGASSESLDEKRERVHGE